MLYQVPPSGTYLVDYAININGHKRWGMARNASSCHGWEPMHVYSCRQATNKPAAPRRAPRMMRKDEVSGTLASGAGGHSMNRPSAIKSTPKACTTFHRMDMRRSVSRAGLSGVSSSITSFGTGREHGNTKSYRSRQKSRSCPAFLPGRMFTRHKEIRKSLRN